MSYIKKKSAKQEQRTAKEFGGKTQVASGALWGAKGDVRTGNERTSSFNVDDYLIENKFTDKDFYNLERKIWEKIDKEALRDNMRVPMMQVDIQDLQLVVSNTYTIKDRLDGYPIKEYELVTKQNSVKLYKSDLLHLINRAKYEWKIPLFIISFLGKVSSYNQLKLAVILKDDFLEL